MQITLNGIRKELLSSSLTVTDLLKELRVDVSQIAVEKNLEIIPRSRYDKVVIAEGDSVELVEFVGGG
jgi:thiamine biosynthesis protein ThiS